MAWYWILAYVFAYLIIGIVVCLIFKRIKGVPELLDLEDNPIALAAVACIWPLIVVCAVFYIPLFGVGRFIEWIDFKINRKND